MTTRLIMITFVFLGVLIFWPLSQFASQEQAKIDPKLTEVWDPVPRVVSPGSGGAPPSDAIGTLQRYGSVGVATDRWKRAEMECF